MLSSPSGLVPLPLCDNNARILQIGRILADLCRENAIAGRQGVWVGKVGRSTMGASLGVDLNQPSELGTRFEE